MYLLAIGLSGSRWAGKGRWDITRSSMSMKARLASCSCGLYLSIRTNSQTTTCGLILFDNRLFALARLLECSKMGNIMKTTFVLVVIVFFVQVD